MPPPRRHACSLPIGNTYCWASYLAYSRFGNGSFSAANCPGVYSLNTDVLQAHDSALPMLKFTAAGEAYVPGVEAREQAGDGSGQQTVTSTAGGASAYSTDYTG